MKPLILSLFTVMNFFVAGAQQTATAPPEALAYKETIFDFGKIAQSKPVYHNFTVVNKSDKPLQIENVQASCGCTTPEWSRDAIAPGGKTDIKVGYNAAAEGPFEKTISVMYGGNTQVLRIKGEVWKTPSTSAPANTSVQFLKSRLQP